MDLLIELHDFVNPAIGPAIKGRFGPTHYEKIISSGAKRSIKDYPELKKLRGLERDIAVREGRPCTMEWVFFTAKGVRG